MANVIIGIPVCNDLETFRHTIKSIMKTTNFPYKLLIVESGSTDGTREYCDLLPKIYPFLDLEIIHTKKEGPLKAYNRIIDFAIKEETDLLMSQTDVIFYKLYKRDWLEIMYNIAQDKQVGAVIPINGGGVSGPDYIEGFPWVGGWCTYLPIRTLLKVGHFDNQFPNGYGVDIDLTYRIHKAGLGIMRINYWVDHHMMNERQHDNDKDTEKAKKEASKYFKKKWKLLS